MRVYIIYRIGDYAIPVAMSLDKGKANTYMKKWNKEDRYGRYFIESRLLSKEVIELDSNGDY